MKILIPGGTGFIGTHLSRKLLELGYDFTIMSRGKLKYDFLTNTKFQQGDICHMSLTKKIVSFVRPDVIVNLADVLYTPTRHPGDYIKTNVIGTINLLEAAKENKTKLIFMSTSGVYGAINNKAQEDFPVNPSAPYETSKYAAERCCLFYQKMYSVPVIILRTFNAYGPKQNPDAKGGVIAKFITQVLNNLPPQISGDGSQTRDFIYITDVINALVKAIELDVSGKILNISSGKEISIKDLACKIIELCGKSDKIEPEYIEPRGDEIIRSVGDNTKAKKFLNWEPVIDLDNGLKQTIDCLKSV